MFNKKILSIIGVLGYIVLFSSSAFARDVTVMIGGWKVIMIVVFGFVIFVGAFGGFIMVLRNGYLFYKLANGSANQQQENAGVKGASVGLAIGACLIASAFIVEIATGTFTGQETSDNAALTELLGAGSGG